MDENQEEDQDSEDYTINFQSASNIYTLQSLLHWAAIELDDKSKSRAAEDLGSIVSMEIGSEEFNENLQQEFEDFKQNIKSPGNKMGVQ